MKFNLLLILSHCLFLEAAIIPGDGCGVSEPIQIIPRLLNEDNMPLEDMACTLVQDPKSFQKYYASTAKKG